MYSYDYRSDVVNVKWLDGDTRFPNVRPFNMFGCRASNARPNNLRSLPLEKMGKDSRYRLTIVDVGGVARTCRTKKLLWNVEWPAVSELTECADLCYQDSECTHIFFQMTNRERPAGVLCQGFAGCGAHGTFTIKNGGPGQTYRISRAGTPVPPSPAASFWSEEAQQECSQTGCLLEWLGDGECQTICSNDKCMHDAGDCTQEGKLMLSKLELVCIHGENIHGWVGMARPASQELNECASATCVRVKPSSFGVLDYLPFC